MTKEVALIIDIDGTLANCNHRRHFVDGSLGKKNWNSFYKEMDKDSINEWCKEIIARFSYVEGIGWCTPILLVSGRPEEYREITSEWINKNLFDADYDSIPYRPPYKNDPYLYFNYKLYMRKTGDYRDDIIIKEEIYKEHIEPSYNVLFAIDDRKKVANMWRKLGLVCLHCAEGDF